MRSFQNFHRQSQLFEGKKWKNKWKKKTLPSVVQAYTQSYSLGGMIKLIICQIRHELSITIQEISTKKKNVRWWTQYKGF